MGFFASLGDAPHLYDVMKLSPRMALYLFKMTDEIMMEEGALTVQERELIAAYVSGLNACSFCYRGHKAIAENFGVSEGLIDELVADLESAALPAKMKAALLYVRKLTQTPSRLTQADSDAVYASGWDEAALMSMIEVTALFAMYNRIADGAGVTAANTQTTLVKKQFGSYLDNLIKFGVPVPDGMQELVTGMRASVQNIES
jgi:uncharacterized peroxidase-related enzyme